jgi:hypothetical protein
VRERNALVRTGFIFWMVLSLMVVAAGADPKITSDPTSVSLASTQPYPVIPFFDIPFTFRIPVINLSMFPGDEKPMVRTFIFETPDNITNLSFFPTEISSEDGSYLVSADGIHATFSPDAVKTGGVTRVPVSFQLANAHAGKYMGNLFFSYQDDTQKRGMLQIPVSITIKDHPGTPIFVLFLGVLCGVLYFSYRKSGMQYDEVKTDFERLRNKIHKDEDFEKLPPDLYFTSQTTKFTGTLKDNLQKRAIDEAKKNLDDLNRIWREWTTIRYTFLEQWHRYEETRKTLQKSRNGPIKASTYFKEADERLGNVKEALFYASDLQTLEAALHSKKQDLQDISDNVDTFEEWVTKAHLLKDKCRQLKDEQCIGKIDGFEEALSGCTWNDVDKEDSALAKLATKICDDYSTKGCEPLEKPDRRSAGVRGASETRDTSKVEPLSKFLNRGFIWINNRLSLARIRLGIFSFVTLLIIVFILLVTGYQQLYLSNATFGASMNDYIGLGLWGLGVGPTSEAFTKAVSQFQSVQL